MSVKLSKPDWGDEGWGDIFQSKPNPFAQVSTTTFGSTTFAQFQLQQQLNRELNQEEA